jgi:hypothetical protein
MAEQVPRPSGPVRRPARSKTGCLTCRTRKVRCDEIRPRCSHCERLNLECKWKTSTGKSDARPGISPTTDGFIGGVFQPRLDALDQLFDYASFMWDAPDCLGQLSPEGTQLPDTSVAAARRPSAQVIASPLTEDRHLIDYFVRTVVPPILAEVETQKRWSSMRQVLISMSNSNVTVRWAILAFSSLLYHRQHTPWLACPPNHYDMALGELASLRDTSFSMNQRRSLLATYFFLAYVDILQDRVSHAHKHLKQAHVLFCQGRAQPFQPIEVRLLSWLRLLDARAVSAGGEGLFLGDASEALLAAQPSPASIEETPEEEMTGNQEGPGLDVEDALFQVIYHPGIIFFQKVQSFMGRISKIDPWHRSRGTVEDETEVMNIASRISKDLRSLYEQRPVLMDHAVAGRLVAPHVSATLAYTITRAFRTYLSNYYASKVHLHRVAYKHLPLSRDSEHALSQIRSLTRYMVETLEPDSSLPVNQLWPLLMLGSEEKDLGEREWIREQIMRMETVATNAKITAQVLDEVQVRQDTTNARVDIRAVMHDIFDSCFPIM